MPWQQSTAYGSVGDDAVALAGAHFLDLEAELLLVETRPHLLVVQRRHHAQLLVCHAPVALVTSSTQWLGLRRGSWALALATSWQTVKLADVFFHTWSMEIRYVSLETCKNQGGKTV
jgi:hypothetical protein